MNADPAAAVLHALRVKGAATVADAGRISGVEPAGPVLETLVADGLAIGSTGFFGPTEAGTEMDVRACAERLGDQAGELARVYEDRFLPVNLRFKSLATAWQDGAAQIELLEEADAIHEEIRSVLAEAAKIAPGMARYRDRLDVHMDVFLDGDESALLSATEDSYHNTWFELHEDLLQTQGRSRKDEAE